MTKTQKNKLIRKIAAKINKVKKEIISFNESAKAIAPEEVSGRFARIKAIKSKSLEVFALREAKMKLNKLERALIKIDSDDFGICFICEKPIPFERIMVMPETTRCDRCENK